MTCICGPRQFSIVAYRRPQSERVRKLPWSTAASTNTALIIHENVPFAYLDYFGEHFAVAQTFDNFGASAVLFGHIT